MQNVVMVTVELLNMTFSSEIYRRLDFGINILDEPDECISVQGIEVSVPTRKHRIQYLPAYKNLFFQI